jgi:ABC-type multidrug transport system fused ATPase/permease subunit
MAGTIRENIVHGKKGASDEEVIAAARMANAHDFISAFEKGYDTFCGEGGAQLSGTWGHTGGKRGGGSGRMMG